jgi:hypothetical protein
MGSGRRPWLVVFLPGVGLMAFGLLILIVPELLVALVAALFMLAGALLAAVGWRLRAAAQAPPRLDLSRWFGDPR